VTPLRAEQTGPTPVSGFDASATADYGRGTMIDVRRRLSALAPSRLRSSAIFIPRLITLLLLTLGRESSQAHLRLDPGTYAFEADLPDRELNP
jgi:hypothetical protein